MVFAISERMFFVIGGRGDSHPRGWLRFNSRSSGVGGHSRGDGVSRGDIRNDTVGNFLLRIWKKNVFPI